MASLYGYFVSVIYCFIIFEKMKFLYLKMFKILVQSMSVYINIGIALSIDVMSIAV